MLCDEILADKELVQLYPRFDIVQRLLRGARKFVLAPDFTTAADGLVNNTRELERIIPFCRLPAPVCWFELAQADRPHFNAAPMHFAALQSAPKRVGFLTVHIDNPPKSWRWLTTLMWSLAHPRYGGPNNVSLMQIAFDTKDGFDTPLFFPNDILARHIEIGVSIFCPPELKPSLQEQKNEFAKLVQSDWGGEIRYLYALLGLFNARNVMESEPIDKAKHNRQRARAGKQPLCSHTVLKIRAMHRRSLIGQRGKGSAADIRKHFVVGHWKARATGLFWWNPFWRGKAEHGEVTHTYEVTT